MYGHVAETKALISCTVTTQLICSFLFIYAKTGFLIMCLIWNNNLSFNTESVTLMNLVNTLCMYFVHVCNYGLSKSFILKVSC